MLGSLWLIPIICLAGAVLNLALGVVRAPKSAVTLVGVGSVGVSVIATYAALWEYLHQPAEVIVEPYFTWISAGVVNVSASLQCFCSERHERVQTKQGRHLSITGILAFAYPTLIFPDTFTFVISIRDLVTETAA